MYSKGNKTKRLTDRRGRFRVRVRTESRECVQGGKRSIGQPRTRGEEVQSEVYSGLVSGMSQLENFYSLRFVTFT